MNVNPLSLVAVAVPAFSLVLFLAGIVLAEAYGSIRSTRKKWSR